MKKLIRKLNQAVKETTRMDVDIKNMYPVGSTVIINDMRFLSYDPDLNHLAEVIDHRNYPNTSMGYIGVAPTHSHVAVEFKTVRGDVKQIAVPVTAIRPPSFVEGLLNKYENRSMELNNSLLARSIRKILRVLSGNLNDHFYSINSDPKPINIELDKFETRELGADKEFAREVPPERAASIQEVIEKARQTQKAPEAKVSKPLLDWDLEDAVGFDESNEPTPVVETPKVIAPAPVETKVETGRTQAQVPNVSTTPKAAFVPKSKEQLLNQAQQNIGMLDREAGIEELEGAAARVEVDAKRMILCRADLNQLVPFKYEWAWQAYLKATEHHWMPLEINLENDIADWKNCTPDQSKLISFALYSLEINGLYKTNDSLLALYRSITNPEARQYILRQRFELTVWGNFVNTVIDNFDYQFPTTQVTSEKTGKTVENCDWYSLNDKNYLSYFKREHIQTRQRDRHDIERFVGDNTFNPTESFEDRLAIVERVIARYICFGFTYNFTSILQLSMLGSTGKFNGLSQGGLFMLRDLALHTSFGVLILQNIFAENPDLLQSGETIVRLRNMIIRSVNLEIDYMDWWANSDLPNAKSAAQIQTLKFMVNRMSVDSGLGVLFDDVGTVAPIPAFVSRYDKFVPDLHGGGSSVLGGGGALAW